MIAGCIQSGVAVRDCLHRIAARFEQSTDIVAQIRVIICKEHVRVLARPRLKVLRSTSKMTSSRDASGSQRNASST